MNRRLTSCTSKQGTTTDPRIAAEYFVLLFTTRVRVRADHPKIMMGQAGILDCEPGLDLKYATPFAYLLCG